MGDYLIELTQLILLLGIRLRINEIAARVEEIAAQGHKPENE